MNFRRSNQFSTKYQPNSEVVQCEKIQIIDQFIPCQIKQTKQIEMDLQNALRCDTLEDIPGLSDELKKMYRDLKRLESTQSNVSNISDFETNEMENPEAEEDAHPVITNQVMEMLKQAGVNVDNIRVVLSKVSCQEEEEYREEITDEEEINKYLAQKSIKKHDSVDSTTESTSTEPSL